MKQRIAFSVMITLLISLAASSAWGLAAGEKKKVVGMIKERGADTITVKTRDAGDVAVVLDDSTRCKMPRGAGFRKQSMSAAVLIPGLNVEVQGVTDEQDRVVAKTITFSKDDLEAAEAIQAGLHTTNTQVSENQANIASNQANIATNKEGIATNQQNIATNKAKTLENEADIEAANKRFDDLTDFDVKNQLTLTYPVGRSELTQAQKDQLLQFAKEAASNKGYLIEVKGFADSQGAATMNQELSMDRAQNVVAFLLQQASVPQRRVVAPGAMGETNATANNETKEGRADNRRVELKVLVNRGLSATKD